jgi:hypothetical protein
MFQRSRKGYVEQQIEMLAEVLALIFTGLRSGHYEAALTEAADACKRLTGLNLTTLTMLPDETLLNLFRMGGGLDPAKCIIAARLLDAQAEIYLAQSRTVAAQACLHKALVLLLAALEAEEALRTDEYRGLVESILARLQDYALPNDLLVKVANYWKTTARDAAGP